MCSALSEFDSVETIRPTRDRDASGTWDGPNEVTSESRRPDRACVCRPSKDDEQSSAWPSDTRHPRKDACQMYRPKTHTTHDRFVLPAITFLFTESKMKKKIVCLGEGVFLSESL